MNLVDEAVAAGARREAAAETLGLTGRTLERWAHRDRQEGDRRRGAHTEPPHKLSSAERDRIREVVNSQPYRDLPPKQIVPRLLDEQELYLASESTIYRILRQDRQMTHRQRAQPATGGKPREHVATGPNQVWSWDISWLPGPIRGTFYHAYMILDVWSRKIVGYALHLEESAEWASQLFAATCQQLGLDPQELVLHADNGGPMKGSTMLATLKRLGVTGSFSRPGVCDDNPFSEALFRTMKYRPEYPPEAFASFEAARGWLETFVGWYNTEHRHSAIRFVTPQQRHSGQEAEILQRRSRIYEAARRRHPGRWSTHTRDWTSVPIVRLNPASTGQRRRRQAA